MKLALLMLISIMVLFSGCVYTGEMVNKTPNITGQEMTELEPEEPTEIQEEPVDLCEGAVCGDTIRTCPDGFVSMCPNPCDLGTGNCLACAPDCTGHEETEPVATIQTTQQSTQQEGCSLECNPTSCKKLDEDKCECVTVLFCDGNGICEQGEYPGSDDCPDCDDEDPCTHDTYDYDGYCEYQRFAPCCGNMECEEGENEQNCPYDCLEEQEGDVRIVYINYDAPGDDKRKENWNGEWVELEGYNVMITDWILEDVGGHTYTFPMFMIQGKIKLHSGDGDNNETDLFWNEGKRPIWNNDGDTATLKDNLGEVVDIYSY